MRFDVITIFPNIFDSYINETILKRAQQKKLVTINIHDIRKFTYDRHRTVDDKPYGGGQGMILKPDPIYRTLKSISKKRKCEIILLTPGGSFFDQKTANKFSKLNQIILISGRYEGIDARVEKLITKKLSVGPYVLSGGELPAMVVMEAVSRLIPGVLGHAHSAKDDTFSVDEDYVEYPQYTRPEKFLNWRVPGVLLSGNHEKIREWRMKHVKKINKKTGNV